MLLIILANLTYSMQEKSMNLFIYRPTHLYATIYYIYWFTMPNCIKKHVDMLYNL